MKFCLNFLLPLALCRCLIWAVNLQIDGQYEPDKHKLPAWQRLSPTIGMSPNSTRQVTDVKLRLAAWVEKPLTKGNVSAKHAQLMLNGQSDTDQSGNASPANFVNTLDQRLEQRTTQRQKIVPAHIGGQEQKRSARNFLGSIYLQREFDQFSQSGPFSDDDTQSPLSRPSNAFDQNLRSQNGNASSTHSHFLKDKTGKKISEVVDDYDQNGRTTSDQSFDHPINHSNKEIVPVDYDFDRTSNASSDQQYSPRHYDQFDYNWPIDAMPYRKEPNANRMYRRSMSSPDYATLKCGKMPKLLPNFSAKMSFLQLKMKLDMQLWKKCIKHSFSDTYLQTANALKHLVEHKHNANDQKDGSKRSKGKLFLHDHAEWEEDGTPQMEWGQNPFDGRTPSFRSKDRS